MTEKLYWKDAYMTEFEAKVTKVDGKRLYLDKTAFYPAGGGQPNDAGRMSVNGKEYKIVDVKKERDEIMHISDTDFDATPNQTAKGMIDWDRRYACMRLHTTVHLIDAVFEKFYTSGMLTGGQIYPDRARFDVDMVGLTREKVQEILDKTNLIAKEGHDVVSKVISREEALSDQRLVRTEPGRELIKSLETVRVVEIVGVDEQADGGTHVKNTREIGEIRLNEYINKGTHNKRIEVVVV